MLVITSQTPFPGDIPPKVSQNYISVCVRDREIKRLEYRVGHMYYHGAEYHEHQTHVCPTDFHVEHQAIGTDIDQSQNDVRNALLINRLAEKFLVFTWLNNTPTSLGITSHVQCLEINNIRKK